MILLNEVISCEAPICDLSVVFPQVEHLSVAFEIKAQHHHSQGAETKQDFVVDIHLLLDVR